MLTNALLPIAFGAVGMIAAFLIYANILKTPSGEGRVKEIADLRIVRKPGRSVKLALKITHGVSLQYFCYLTPQCRKIQG